MKLLADHNAKWSVKWQQWCAYGGAPWWGRGSIVTQEMRCRYNAFLPPDEFRSDLLRLAKAFFHDAPERVPYALRGEMHAEDTTWLSLPDLWATLHDAYASRVIFDDASLLGLFCNLAEPARMGTDTGRYPAQLAFLKRALACRASVSVLDIGCGTGLGTYELARALATVLPQEALRVTGMTIEPLDVWMAQNRRLPHDPVREARLAAVAQGLSVAFCVGDVTDFTVESPVDVIVCNGLLGGRFLNAPAQLRSALACAKRALRPSGLLVASNHFHEGCRPACEAFAAMAQDDGWRVNGEWQSLILKRES